MLRVLIPSCTDALLSACISSMERNEPGSSACVIVADNGLSPKFRHYHPQLTYVLSPRPFVYSRAINQAASALGPDDDIMIMGDDSHILTPDWRRRCEEVLRHTPEEFGCVHLIEGAQAIFPPQSVRFLLAFVAVLIPRRAWDQIGPMDERYTAYGYDDFDYELRCLHAGLEIGRTGAVVFRHEGSATYRPWAGGTWEGLDAMKQLNLQRFAGKWGWTPAEGFPQSEPHLNRSACACTNLS